MFANDENSLSQSVSESEHNYLIQLNLLCPFRLARSLL
jgi:hypothetical protein